MSEGRAQVGIGTLIVFIAMVLVAAIAAGVLLNTAGMLQTQAEQTGIESTQQVANNLNVITETGIVGHSEETIDEVRIGVQPAAGSGVLDLEQVTAQYVSDNSFGSFVHISSASLAGSGTVFSTEPITANDGQDNVMTDSSDRYNLVFPLGDERPFVVDADLSGDEGTLAIDEDGNEVVLAESDEADRIAALDVVVEDSAVKGDVAAAFAVDEAAVIEVSVPDGDAGNVEDAELFFDDTDGDSPGEGSDEDDFGTSVDATELDSNTDVNRFVVFADSVDAEALDGYDEDDEILDDTFLESLDNDDGIDELQESEEAELTFTTGSGAQTMTVLKVPDTLASETEGDGIDL